MDKDMDDEYKEDNSEAPKSDENIINRTESEKALTDCLMSMNFPIKGIHYVVGTFISCEQNIIESVKRKKIKQI